MHLYSSSPGPCQGLGIGTRRAESEHGGGLEHGPVGSGWLSCRVWGLKVLVG